jgi:hypothetical protein
MHARSVLIITMLCTPLGCDDSSEPEWFNTAPDTVLLYSLARAEHFGMPSAFDMIYARRVVVEAEGETGSWDFAVLDGVDGFSFVMPGAFPGLAATSSIMTANGTPFDALTEAPRTGYDSLGIALDAGAVYIVRTRTVTDASGNSCHYYGKLEPVEIDAILGTLLFRHLTNPTCNSRGLSPPED